MLPQPVGPSRYRSSSIFPEYLSRILRWGQMDIEYSFWQMFYLCIDPSRVYRTTSWRKQTKNQWARDDPAFVVIMVFFQAVASFSFAVAFQAENLLTLLKLIFWSTFVEFIGFGIVVATIGWFIANKYLRVNNLHSVEQRVEWLYAFDIHCNSFFPFFIFLYVFQFFCLPFFLSSSFLSLLLANTLYAIALGYYYYITFLGYNILPFLNKTEFFLYPIALVVLLYIISIVFNINFTIFFMNYYFGG